MRRDFELIRLLLFDLERETDVDLSSYSTAEINYHKALITQAGLAEGAVNYSTGLDASTDVPDFAVLTRLTWEGHEFLDQSKSEKTWSKAKDIIKQKGLTISLEALKIALLEAVKMAFR